MSLINQLLEGVSSLNQNLLEFLKENNLEIIEQIGKGTRGKVYLLKNRNCLKITKHDIEFSYNDYKQLEGEENEYLVDIYKVYKFKNYLIIEMEKLTEVKFNMFKKFDKYHSEEFEIKEKFLSFINYDNDDEDINDAINKFMESKGIQDLLDRSGEDKDTYESIVWDLDFMFNAQRELENKFGLYLKDFHSKNVMSSEKTDDYKVIDFI